MRVSICEVPCLGGISTSEQTMPDLLSPEGQTCSVIRSGSSYSIVRSSSSRPSLPDLNKGNMTVITPRANSKAKAKPRQAMPSPSLKTPGMIFNRVPTLHKSPPRSRSPCQLPPPPASVRPARQGSEFTAAPSPTQALSFTRFPSFPSHFSAHEPVHSFTFMHLANGPSKTVFYEFWPPLT